MLLQIAYIVLHCVLRIDAKKCYLLGHAVVVLLFSFWIDSILLKIQSILFLMDSTHAILTHLLNYSKTNTSGYLDSFILSSGYLINFGIA